ncbi:MAG: hypothetical protein IIC75_04160 [Bacteroidetes bacterium]|nr:hypothetical protein [Bacteroidota bacterium]
MDLTGFGMNFFRASDIAEGDSIKILSEGEQVENNFGKKRISFFIEHKAEQKVMQLAMPHVKQLIKILGTETKKWIGKTVNVKTEERNLFETGKKTLTFAFVKLVIA